MSFPYKFIGLAHSPLRSQSQNLLITQDFWGPPMYSSHPLSHACASCFATSPCMFPIGYLYNEQVNLVSVWLVVWPQQHTVGSLRTGNSHLLLFPQFPHHCVAHSRYIIKTLARNIRQTLLYRAILRLINWERGIVTSWPFYSPCHLSNLRYGLNSSPLFPLPSSKFYILES